MKNSHVMVVLEPERIGVFLTRSCVHVTDISCGVVYEATLASLVLFRSYCYVSMFVLVKKQWYPSLKTLFRVRRSRISSRVAKPAVRL